MFQQYFGQTVFAIDTRSICERGSGFARRHAALENARTGGGKQSARARVRRGRDDAETRYRRRRRLSTDDVDDDDEDDDDNVLSARRHAAYCFVDCSALLSRWRAARPAMRRVEPLEWSSRFADRPLLLLLLLLPLLLPSSSSREAKGRKRRKERCARSAQVEHSRISRSFGRSETEFALLAIELIDSRNVSLKGAGRVGPDPVPFISSASNGMHAQYNFINLIYANGDKTTTWIEYDG